MSEVTGELKEFQEQKGTEGEARFDGVRDTLAEFKKNSEESCQVMEEKVENLD